MVKLIAMFRRKPGMSQDEFIERYENQHVRLAVELVPFFKAYTRSYVGQAMAPSHLTANAPAFEFHVVTQLWYDGMDSVNRQGAALAGETGERIAADEAEQFDREQMLMFLTDERITPAETLAPRPAGVVGEPPIKMMCLLTRKPGMSDEAFIDYYEQHHAVLAVNLLRNERGPLFAGYSRNFTLPNGAVRPPHVTTPPPPMEFDVLTEMWFWTEADLQAFFDLLAQPAIGAAIAADEEKLFDRNKIFPFMATEFATPPDAIKASAAALGVAV